MEAENGSDGSQKRLTLGFLVSFIALLSKQASRVSAKLKAKPTKTNSNRHTSTTTTTTTSFMSPRSPMKARPKQLITNIGNRASTFIQKKKGGAGEEGNGGVYGGESRLDDHDEFGDGGVWQRTILMGGKCQPLDFSGVIYYDSSGKRLSEVPPRSPRASPLPSYLARHQEL